MNPGRYSHGPGPSLRRRLEWVLLAVAIADAVVIVVSTWIGWRVRVDYRVWTSVISNEDWPAVLSLSMAAVWLIVLGAHGAYATRSFGSGPEEFRALAAGSVVAAASIGLFAYLTDYYIPRGFLVVTFAVGLPLLLVQRYAARKLLHRLRRAGRLMRRVLAVGPSQGIVEVSSVLERAGYAGYRIVAVVLTDEPTGSVSLNVPVVDTADGLVTACEKVTADTVLVARGGLETSSAMRRITWELEDTPIELVVVPSLTDVASPRIQMRPVAGLPLLHVERPTAREAGGLPKRLFDVVGSVGILTLFAPVLLVIALAVKLQDGGPVFFRQDRVGRHGERFRMVKFRSMVVDAEARLTEVEHLNEAAGVLFKMKRDPRVTRVGAFLRKYSLDELPQLFNVLAGSMSLVGPRPPLPSEVEKYGFDTHRRLAVRPGMTGLWQVSGRSELSWEESVRLDLYYVDNWSLMADVVIILKTLRAVVAGSGAY